MRALLFLPLAIGLWATGDAASVEREQLGSPPRAVVVYEYEHPGDATQYGHDLTVGTATALSRPPGGYPNEQPLPKSVQEIRWPDL